MNADVNNDTIINSNNTQAKLTGTGHLFLGRIDGAAGAYLKLGKYGGLVYEDSSDTFAKIVFKYQASAGAGWSYTSVASIMANNVLWSGAYWMGGSQSCTLNANVTSQTNGIVLVWSWYDTSTAAAANHDFHLQFVPKGWVSLYGGCGFWTANPYIMMAKYVYVSNTTVKGNDYYNTTTTDINGLKRKNNKNFVLRAVIGV